MASKKMNRNIENLKKWIESNQDRLIGYSDVSAIGNDAIDCALVIYNVIAGMNGTDLSGFASYVGWVRRVVCAVTHQACRQAPIKKGVVLLRNAWWVTQKTLTCPLLLSLSQCHSLLALDLVSFLQLSLVLISYLLVSGNRGQATVYWEKMSDAAFGLNPTYV
jgi:hypothetical protein